MATYATPLANGKTSAAGFLRIVGKLFTSAGVIEDSALTVAAQTSPDKSVKISGSSLNDNAVFIGSDGRLLHAWNTSSVDVTIADNTSGSAKTDAIVAYVDLTAYDASNANNPGSLKFIAVRGASGNPSSGEITASVVGSNPYILLAYVAVANGFGSINSGNITSQRVKARIAKGMLQQIGTDQVESGITLTNPTITYNANQTSGSTRVKLLETVVGSPAGSVTLSSIPATYRNLILVWSGKNSGSSAVNLQVRFNGDTGSNYHGQYMTGNNASVSASQEVSVSAPSIGVLPGSTAGANVYNMGEVVIPFYANTSMEKQYIAKCMRVDGKSSGNLYNENKNGHWASTTAINSITILAASNNIVAGSTFTLYGDP